MRGLLGVAEALHPSRDGRLDYKYFYALFKNAQVHRIDPSALSTATDDMTVTLGMTSWDPDSLWGLGQDVDGELYVIRVDPGIALMNNGKIYKIVP